MDPDVGLDGPIAAMPRIRQRLLAAADRAMEIKVFSVLQWRPDIFDDNLKRFGCELGEG
jgi:hypothetical protein